MDRLRFVNFAVIISFIFLSLGQLNLALFQGRKFKELSDKNCIRLIAQLGARGKILDRQGDAIVDNELSYDAMVMPQEPRQLDKLFANVSNILGKNKEDLRKTYNAGYIAPSIPVTIAKKIPVEKASALKQDILDYPGLIIQPNPQRRYPYARLASHVVGYLSEIDRWRLTKLEDYGYKTKDIVGFGGVEEKYDYYLRQEEGGTSVEVDHKGKIVRTLGFQQPRNGKDIQLTLDLKLQKIVEESLGGKNGSVVIMGPFTGEIIAMASSPGFNPAVFVNQNAPSITAIINNSDSPLTNRAISSSFPAGSVFKTIVATAGLETKKINLSTIFVCPGHMYVGRREFKCWDTHGEQDLIAAIAHSCNVFFYHTGLLLGPQNLRDFAIKFGLSHSTSFDLPYEVSGNIPTPLWKRFNKFQNWFDGDTANFSIGQGDVLVTPLQMARVIAVFANKGYLVTPYVIKSIDYKDVSVNQRKPQNLNLKASTIDNIRQGLRNVVSNSKGTANVLSGLPIEVAGKTGTAQAPPGQAHAWFTGFFPYQNPKYAICVLLEHGGPGYYACLVAKQIIEKMIQENLI